MRRGDIGRLSGRFQSESHSRVDGSNFLFADCRDDMRRIFANDTFTRNRFVGGGIGHVSGNLRASQFHSKPRGNRLRLGGERRPEKNFGQCAKNFHTDERPRRKFECRNVRRNNFIRSRQTAARRNEKFFNASPYRLTCTRKKLSESPQRRLSREFPNASTSTPSPPTKIFGLILS